MMYKLKKQLPNIITLSRIISLVVGFILFMKGNTILSLIFYIYGAISDSIDGYFARKLNANTKFGQYLDAISDKLLTNSVLIILGCSGKISAAIVVVIIARDIVVDSIKMVIGNKGHAVAAIGIAKVKTATLMIGIILTLFYNLPFELISLRISDFLLALAAILSVISGVKYYMMAKPYLKDR